MLNNTGIKTEKYGATNQILFAVEHQVSMGEKKKKNLGVTVGTKKIVKAGTPLKGSLLNRDEAFTVGAKDDAVVGIAEHDVDVTAGTANGGIIVFGFIDESKLDTDVVTLLDTANTDTTKLRDKLTKITFCK